MHVAVVECFSLKDGDPPVFGDDDYSATFAGFEFWFK
jgi:hypothetical protein